MTNKLTLTEQEELFAKDCKLINLKYEYDGYNGTEKWAIITELTEEELWDKYPDIIGRYIPFVLLSVAQGKVIIDDNRETHRCEMRGCKTFRCLFCYEDDLFEQFHNEAFLDFVDPFELREAEEIAERKELQRLREIEKVRIVLSMMKPAQERRLYKFVIEGKSCREIAAEEGTYHSSVSKSIEAAKKKFLRNFMRTSDFGCPK